MIGIVEEYYMDTYLFEGDTLSHVLQKPKEIIKKIQWWLKKRFGIQFKDCGDDLEHGKQEDFTDCGIACANTAARELFEDPLWSDEQKGDQRVRWFITLTKKHIKEVSVLINIY